MKYDKGFTIIELMVVVAVIGILAAIAVPQYQNYIKKSQFAEVINMTSAIKISDALCMKEYNVKIGCSGGTNNVIQDITPLNKSKYTLSVVTLDGVITATARGPNDAAAIAAAGGPPVPTATESVAPTVAERWTMFAMKTGGAVYGATAVITCAQEYPFQGHNFSGVVTSAGVCLSYGTWNGILYTNQSDGSQVSKITNAVCPTPASGSAYTYNSTNQMCERPNSNPPAPVGNPGTALTNETYILNPNIDATGKITYTVGGTCIAAGLCQAN